MIVPSPLLVPCRASTAAVARGKVRPGAAAGDGSDGSAPLRPPIHGRLFAHQ